MEFSPQQLHKSRVLSHLYELFELGLQVLHVIFLFLDDQLFHLQLYLCIRLNFVSLLHQCFLGLFILIPDLVNFDLVLSLQLRQLVLENLDFFPSGVSLLPVPDGLGHPIISHFGDKIAFIGHQLPLSDSFVIAILVELHLFPNTVILSNEFLLKLLNMLIRVRNGGVSLVIRINLIVSRSETNVFDLLLRFYIHLILELLSLQSGLGFELIRIRNHVGPCSCFRTFYRFIETGQDDINLIVDHLSVIEPTLENIVAEEALHSYFLALEQVQKPFEKLGRLCGHFEHGIVQV